MTDWREKNVGVMLRKGTSRKRPVVNEDDGTKAGHYVDHWDDRSDAVATPKSVHIKVKATTEEQ